MMVLVSRSTLLSIIPGKYEKKNIEKTERFSDPSDCMTSQIYTMTATKHNF